MGRLDISLAKSISDAPSPRASFRRVRPTRNDTAAEVTASVIGTRSMTLVATVTRLIRKILGRQEEKRADTRLVGTERIAARLEHLLFQQRDTGDMHQQKIHESRAGQR